MEVEREDGMQVEEYGRGVKRSEKRTRYGGGRQRNGSKHRSAGYVDGSGSCESAPCGCHQLPAVLPGRLLTPPHHKLYLPDDCFLDSCLCLASQTMTLRMLERREYAGINQ
jgi:hypothetical protein